MKNDLFLESIWDNARARSLDEPGLLLYRSNLLGSDLRIANFGGGNTSTKVLDKDPEDGNILSIDAGHLASFTR